MTDIEICNTPKKRTYHELFQENNGIDLNGFDKFKDSYQSSDSITSSSSDKKACGDDLKQIPTFIPSIQYTQCMNDECFCPQEILYQQLHPSLFNLIKPNELLRHWNGYVIPSHSELEQLPLSKKYSHERDKNIVFYDPPYNRVHKYILKGVLVNISCTGLIGQFHEHFDGKNAIKAMIKNPRFPIDHKYEKYRSIPIYVWNESNKSNDDNNNKFPDEEWQKYFDDAHLYGDKLYKMPVPISPFKTWCPGMQVCNNWDIIYRLISNSWDKNADEASSDGTHLHLCCEYWANKMVTDQLVIKNDSKEFGYAKQFFEDMKLEGFVPYRTEQIVYDEELNLSGSVDLQLQKIENVEEESEISIAPQESSEIKQRSQETEKIEKMEETSSFPKKKEIFLFDHKRAKDISKENHFRNMSPPLEEFPDTNYFHYTIQLNIYAWILEKHYDVKIIGMALSIFHPNKETYQRIPVERRIDLIEKIFEIRKSQIKK